MKNIRQLVVIFSITLIALFKQSPSFAQGITISGGSHLVMNGAVSMVVNNASIKNNGKFTANTSTVKFTGNKDTASSIVSGDSATNFYNLTVAKSNYGLAPRSTTCTSNSSVSSSGNLYINDYLIMANTVLINNKTKEGCAPKEKKD